MNNYSFDDIDNLNADELKDYIAYATVMQHKFDKLQHSAKILLNSLYGALGTPYFRFFNIWCAEAITLTGQACTAQSYEVFNSFQQNILKDSIDRVIAGDTDSCVGSTIINVNNKDISIEDYYNSKSYDYSDKKDVIKINGDLGLTSDGKNILQKPIKYVMRHKVNKKMYKITVGENSVTVTEDHSIMVLHNNKLISKKPNELLGTETVLYII